MTTLEHTVWTIGFLLPIYLLGKEMGKRRGIELTIAFLRENDLLKEELDDE